MTMMTTQSDHPPAALNEIDASYLGDGPGWLTQLREKALARFTDMGLPTIRHEDWRVTNLAALKQIEFALPAGQGNVLRADVKPFVISGLDCTQLVFVNGHFCEDLSDLSDLPRGVTLMSLAQAISVDHPLLREHLSADPHWQDDALACLNDALAEEGVLLHVAKGVVVEKPIHILNIATAADTPYLMNHRNLIVVDQSASVVVVEDYVAMGEDIYLNNAMTKIVIDDNAHATHYLIVRDSNRAFNNSLLNVTQGRDSHLTSHAMLFGGRVIRNNVHLVLEGDNCFSLMNGLYVIEDEQIADSHMRVEHKALAGDSRQYYKGIMHDKAKGVFRGRIVVHPGAQKTDAKQSNQNLLLSKQASANTDPQLEIYADDVKCTHGATIGQINKDQVFYLMARGIPYDLARSMIVVAFASESLDRIADEPIRRLMHSMLFDRLPEASVLSQML